MASIFTRKPQRRDTLGENNVCENGGRVYSYAAKAKQCVELSANVKIIKMYYEHVSVSRNECNY